MVVRSFKLGMFVAAAIVMGSSYTVFSAVPQKSVVAQIGKETITLQELNDRIKSFPAQYQEALQQKENKAKILDQMIDEKLIIMAAKKAGVDKSPAYKQQIQEAERQLLVSTIVRDRVEKNATVTDAEAKEYYEKNPQQFQELEQRNASHILVKTEAEANEIAAQLKKGADFAAIAKEKSQDPGTAVNGGSLGFFTRGQMVAEFESAAFGLQKGQTSDPVKSQFGYHIIKLNDVQVRPKVEFTAQVAQQIKEAIVNEKKRLLTTQYLDQLKKDVKVKKDVSKI